MHGRSRKHERVLTVKLLFFGEPVYSDTIDENCGLGQRWFVHAARASMQLLHAQMHDVACNYSSARKLQGITALACMHAVKQHASCARWHIQTCTQVHASPSHWSPALKASPPCPATHVRYFACSCCNFPSFSQVFPPLESKKRDTYICTHTYTRSVLYY